MAHDQAQTPEVTALSIASMRRLCEAVHNSRARRHQLETTIKSLTRELAELNDELGLQQHNLNLLLEQFGLQGTDSEVYIRLTQVLPRLVADAVNAGVGRPR